MAKYITISQVNKSLSKDVAERFEAAEIGKLQALKFVSAKYGRVDFENMSVKTAEMLVKKGCPYLKEKPKAKKGD